MVMGADGSDLRLLAGAPYSCADPAWSPDGRWLALRGAAGANHEVCVVSAEGGPVSNISAHPAGDHEPAWSPNGAEIAFTSDRDGDMAIYVMNATGNGAARRMTPEGIVAWAPTWTGGPETFAVQARDRHVTTWGAIRAR